MYTITAGGITIYTPGQQGVLSPTLSLGRNKAGSLTFTLCPGASGYDEIQMLKMPVECYRDDTCVFYGRIIGSQKDDYNCKTITCEGALSFLHDVPCEPFTLNLEGDNVVEQMLSFLLDMYNAKADAWKRIYLGNVTVHEPTNALNRYTTEVNTDMFEAITNKTCDSPLGGVLQIRREHGVTYLDYLADSDLVSTQGIEFGKNLLSIAQEQNAENIFTVIVPYGNENEETGERVTIESVNDGLNYIESPEGIERYSKIWRVVEYEGVASPEVLYRRAQADLALGITDPIAFTVNAVDLNLIDKDVAPIECGYLIPIVSDPHGINQYIICEAQEIKIDEPTESTFEFGSINTITSQQIQDRKNVLSVISASAEAAAEEINTVKSAITVTMQLQTGEEEIGVDANSTVTGTIIFPEAYMYKPQVNAKIESENLTLSITGITKESFSYSITNQSLDIGVEDTLHWIAKV